MSFYYRKICTIIEEELDFGNDIAIFPMGKNGTESKYILENRYGKKGILVDNNICRYNEAVISIDTFLNTRYSNSVSVIVTAGDCKLNNQFICMLEAKGFSGRIRSILEYQVQTHEEKEAFFGKIKEKCKVKGAVGYELVRVGAMHDGGYVMLNDFEPGYKAYSFGVGNDMSWDEDLAKKGIDVHCFDPTVLGIKTSVKGIFFKKIGIGSVDNIKESLFSMESILNNNQEKSNNLILKMDVEGAEWGFIDTVSTETIRRFRQITFELHELTDITKSEIILRCLAKLNETHQPVWIHANNNCGIEFGEKTGVPPLLEITFANKEQYKFRDVSYDAPTNLDAPNVDRFFDVRLDGWGSLLD